MLLIFINSKISEKVAFGFAWQKAKAIRGGSSIHKHLLSFELKVYKVCKVESSLSLSLSLSTAARVELGLVV
ncbi:MAG: hypothetical protein HS119_06615 [Flavobacteriales bacterium]|nr:hypothetical protein [Flavobacteriales bacterium]